MDIPSFVIGYYVQVFAIVIQSVAKNLNTSTNAFQILHCTSFRSE